MPAILRSIYAYHVKSRGWSDIGYNFLVDRFGRIWEGRYGGIDRPVIGAHTLNYNQYSFAMSAIGNFDVVQPPDVMLRSYGALFAWKLSLHGVDPASTSQKIGSRTFAAINGHRDAGSTACPGRYLYAQLPTIRTYASTAAPTPPTGPTPVAVSAPNPQNNLDASPYPDLVVRRAADGRGLVLPTGGLTSFQKRLVVGKRGWHRRADVLVSPDLTGDGLADLVTVDKSGAVRVRAGKGNGKFGATTRKMSLRGYSLITAAGDVNGDGRDDLVARFKGRLTVLLATGKGGFSRKVTRKGYSGYRQIVGAGDVNSDGRADLIEDVRSFRDSVRERVRDWWRRVDAWQQRMWEKLKSFESPLSSAQGRSRPSSRSRNEVCSGRWPGVCTASICTEPSASFQPSAKGSCGYSASASSWMWIFAPVARARRPWPETWSAWLWVSSTWPIRTPCRRARRR